MYTLKHEGLIFGRFYEEYYCKVQVICRQFTVKACTYSFKIMKYFFTDVVILYNLLKLSMSHFAFNFINLLIVKFNFCVTVEN